MDYKVSVIIPCYNHAKYLGAAVRSCLIQSYPVEVIIVDDGSEDETMQVGTSYSFEENVRYVHQENDGLPSARNTGIEIAKGELIVCLDADDKLHPKCIEKMVEKYKTGVGIIRVGMRYFGKETGEYFPQPVTLETEVVANQIYVSSMFPKKIWEEVGGYDDEMRKGYEDWDFWVRIMALEYAVVDVPEILFFYRKHGESLSTIANANAEEITKYMNDKWKKLF